MSEPSVSTIDPWFGLERLRLDQDDNAVDVTIGAEQAWDRTHLRRLRQSGELPGMVPVIDSDFATDGSPFAVTPMLSASNLAERMAQGELDWTAAAGVTEAAARAVHEAHLRSLYHGAISTADVYLVDDEVAVAGVGLGHGGRPGEERLAYAAPEVRNGAAPTERSDVYSLGRILEEVLGEQLEQAPRSIRRLIMWSSSDTPEARPPSAMEFASILAEGLGEDRSTFRPAFISTTGLTDLAAAAGSVVAGRTPADDVAGDDASMAETVVAGVAVAGAAAAATTVPAAGLGNGDEGFTLMEPDAPPTDSDADLDDGDLDDGAEADASPDSDTIDTVEVDATDDDATDDVAEDDEAEGDADDQDEEFGEVNPEGDTADSFFAGDTDTDEADTDAEAVADEDEYDVPLAATTTDYDKGELVGTRRNWAAWVIGVLLLAGAAGLVYGMITAGSNEEATSSTDGQLSSTTAGQSSNDEASTDQANSATSVAGPATTEATTTTAAPTTTEATTTTVAPTTTEATTTTTEATTTTAAPTTTEAPAQADASQLLPQAEGPIGRNEAGVQILHGVPGAEVDVYVDGQAVTTGFTAGSIAGPVDLGPGSYDVQLFAASDSPTAAAADRSDDAIVTSTVTVSDAPASVIAHLGADGNPTISTFGEDLADLDPGTGRVSLRHLAAAGAVTVTADGAALSDQPLEAGQSITVELDAGATELALVAADGSTVISDRVTVKDGEFIALSAIGSSDDGTLAVVAQVYSGLATAPETVPTGNSGLLGIDDDRTTLRIVYGVMAAMMAGGAVLAFRSRRRHVS